METSEERRQLHLSFPKTWQSVVCKRRRRFVLWFPFIIYVNQKKKGLDTLYNMRYNKEEMKSYIGVVYKDACLSRSPIVDMSPKAS